MYENPFVTAMYVGLAFAAIVALLGISFIPGSPKEIKIKISREIEEKIKGAGLVLSKKKFLENRFTEYRGFGGAGGLGTARAGALDIEDFVKTAKDLGVKWIFYAIRKIDGRLVKKYWTSTSEGVMIEYKEIYSVQRAENISAEYSIEKFDENEVLFEKDISASIENAILGGLLIGLIAFVIVLFALVVIF
ncbi:MAG: hypothetical protein WC788_01425 [Candidatus Paceibacterota bacterium]|jgi:hypothetical protein